MLNLTKGPLFGLFPAPFGSVLTWSVPQSLIGKWTEGRSPAHSQLGGRLKEAASVKRLERPGNNKCARARNRLVMKLKLNICKGLLRRAKLVLRVFRTAWHARGCGGGRSSLTEHLIYMGVLLARKIDLLCE